MLTASRRLRLRRDFERIFADRRAIVGRFFRAKTAANHKTTSRFAVVVSSKVHKRAVVRNRVRRRAWSALSQFVSLAPTGQDIVFVAAPNSATAAFSEIKSDIQTILKKYSHFS